MRYQERYACSVNSSNLTVDERTTWADSDVIGAAGMAAHHFPLGVALMRLFDGSGSAQEVIESMADEAMRKRNAMRIKISRVEVEDLCRAALAWHRAGTCPECGGTRKQLIPGTPHLSEIDCVPCNGSGRMLYRNIIAESRIPLFEWLIAAIKREQVNAGCQAMRNLAPRLDL